MKTIIAKLSALSVLFTGGLLGHSQYQYQSRPQQTAPVQQHYSPPQPQQYQNRQQYPARRLYNSGSNASPYDPLAGQHKGQNRPGGFWQGVKNDINPCGKSYGLVLDGWHDMGLLMTVRSMEWWLAVIFLVALVTVGFDDLFRMWRANDVREAMAGAALLFMNDRAHAVAKCNEAIYRHNILVQDRDEAMKEMDAQARVEMNDAVRRAAVQATEANTNPEDGPISNAPPPTAGMANHTAPVATVLNPVDGPARPNEITNPSISADGSDGTANHADGDSPDMVTLNLGGVKYKVARPVLLHVNSLNRKIENLRTQNNKLEERLKRYEKD